MIEHRNLCGARVSHMSYHSDTKEIGDVTHATQGQTTLSAGFACPFELSLENSRQMRSCIEAVQFLDLERVFLRRAYMKTQSA
jgi:hypothetical protein